MANVTVNITSPGNASMAPVTHHAAMEAISNLQNESLVDVAQYVFTPSVGGSNIYTYNGERLILVNTVAAPCLIRLPFVTGGSVGKISVIIKDQSGHANTHPIRIEPFGSNVVNGGHGGYEIYRSYGAIELTWDGATWNCASREALGGKKVTFLSFGQTLVGPRTTLPAFNSLLFASNVANGNSTVTQLPDTSLTTLNF